MIKSHSDWAGEVVQWLRLHTPKAEGLGLIRGKRVRSHMLQQLKSSHTTTKNPACHNLKKKKKSCMLQLRLHGQMNKLGNEWASEETVSKFRNLWLNFSCLFPLKTREELTIFRLTFGL